MADNPSKKAAERKVAEFTENLERRLKNLHPWDYLPFAALKLRQVLENQATWRRYPPHFILHSMEANCAFHRQGHHAQFKARTFDRIMNVYKGFDDPVALHILNQGKEVDLDLFFLMHARQQFVVQGKWGRYRLAGGIQIFLEGSFNRTEALFESKFGLSFADWIGFCHLVNLAGEEAKDNATINGPSIRADKKLLSDSAVTAGLGLLSRTVEKLRAEYFEVRRNLHSPLQEHHLPSLLTDRPLVRVNSDSYVVTHSPFLLSCSVEGIYDLCHTHFETAFGSEIGSAFEDYVGRLLNEIPGAKVLIEEKELARCIQGKVCDYLLAMKDIVLLVECKATSYSSTFATQNAIRQDNSTTKIVDGFGQLSNVAKHVHDPVLSSRIGEVGDRMVTGIVVTFKHIRFANSSIYRDIVDSQVKLAQEFTNVPQVLDCGALETLILAACGGHSISSVFEEMFCSKTIVPPEWNSFLIEFVIKRFEIGSEPKVPLLEDTLSSFFANLSEAEAEQDS